ncbi:MAG: ROK family protein [Planctomycetales bacterium]|nr:ROK family protein [Planctomycetales bacterium]
MSYFVGVDIGGTTSTIAIGDGHGRVVHVSDQFATNAVTGPDASIRAIVDAIQAGISAIGATPDQISAVGLATPGPATLDGILLKTPNLNPDLWDRYPIRGGLETGLRAAGFDLCVHYIGDGQAAALGEYAVRKGELTGTRESEAVSADASLNSLFMVIVGTGLGGGEIREGRVVRGLEGRAGHAGHVLLPSYAFRYEQDGQLQVGNAQATVESAVSLTGLTHQLSYRLQLEQWKNHPLNQAEGSVRDKAKRLRELADAGDELALQLFDDQARALGIAMLNYNYLGDYDLLVIGGGVCDLSESVRERYRKAAEDAYRQYALDGFRNLSHMEFSACGDAAPVLGALAHAVASHSAT